MNESDNDKRTPDKRGRRKSDMTLLGTSSQDMEDKVYTLEFGVNLSQISFEGLNNYSVTVSCHDKKTDTTESFNSSLEIRLREESNILSIEGGPPCAFEVGPDTLDLTHLEIDKGVIRAVNKGLGWLRGDSDTEWLVKNRRQVPEALLGDPIAINLLMSSISTVIGEAMACHRTVMQSNNQPFSSRSDYVNAMFDCLKGSIEELTEIAIHRAVKNLMSDT